MATLLIVEDNPANLKLARVVLERAGHAVLEAMDAEAGLAIAREKRPDLILMDIQLPGMDGLSATVELKRDPATAAIPVLALTAHAMMGDEEKIRAAGCDGYLTKPFRYPELLARVAAMLSLPSPLAGEGQGERGAAAKSPPSPQPSPIEGEGASTPLPPRGGGAGGEGE